MPAPLPEVRASRFVLADSHGHNRLLMELVDDQPIVKLLGRNGAVQVRLESGGSKQINLWTRTDGSEPQILIRDHTGRITVELPPSG